MPIKMKMQREQNSRPFEPLTGKSESRGPGI